MDPDITLPPEGDEDGTPPEETPETPAVTPKPKTVPYDSYKKKMDDTIRLNKRVKELEAAETTRNSTNQTEAQRLQKQLDDANAELTTTRTSLRSIQVDRQVESAARELKFRDPADALGLIRAKLDIDDDGTVINAEDLLEALAKSKPYLLQDAVSATPPAVAAPKAAPKAPPAQGGSPTNPANKKPLARSDLKGMKPEEIMKLFGTPEMDALVKVKD